MTPPLHAVDDEFADFVRARQHQVLRVAYLLCGDEERAEDLARGAFATLWLHWRAVHDEDLDAFTRRALHRAATARKPRARDAATPSTGERLSHSDALRSALAGLTPRQRAVVVLLHHERRSVHAAGEALGISAGAVAAQERTALGVLHEAVPHLVGDPAVTGHHTDLGRLLDTACERVVERDLVDSARRAARVQRQRRRRTRAGVLAVVVAVGAGLAVVPRGEGPVPPPTLAPTSAGASTGTGWDLREVDVLGVATQVGPTARQLAGLPPVSDLTRSQLALPEVLGFGPDTVIPALSDVGGNGAPVRAVLLRHAAQGFRAVLVRPTLANPYVLVDTIPLVRTLDEGGNLSEPLEVKAVADDRRHVMFVQPGKVVVLDAFTAEVRSFAVPDRYLEEGGWVGSEIIVSSATGHWRVSPDTGRVSRLGPSAYPGAHQLRVVGADALRILGFDGQGAPSASRTGPSVLREVWGATFTNDDDLVASGGFLSDGAAQELDGSFQGVLSIDATNPGSARLLVAPGSDEFSVGCCEVLAWAFQDDVLLRWQETHLLMWNARSGALLRVSTLPGAQQEPPVVGSPGQSVAIAP